MKKETKNMDILTLEGKKRAPLPDGHTERQTDGQTEWQTEGETDRQTGTDGQREKAY